MGRMLDALGMHGAAGIDFLGDERLVIWFLVIAGSWTCYGFNMVVFLAALQGIFRPREEALVYDGKSGLGNMWVGRITEIGEGVEGILPW